MLQFGDRGPQLIDMLHSISTSLISNDRNQQTPYFKLRSLKDVVLGERFCQGFV